MSAKPSLQGTKESGETGARSDSSPGISAKPAEVPTALARSSQEPRHTELPVPSAVPAKPEPPSSTLPGVAGIDGPLAGLALDGAGAADGHLVLDLEATELSWVVVQIDNGSPQEALLRSGERAHWEAQDQFILTLGNAGGVKAELNGKPQKPFGPSGKVARDIVLKR
ncbi:MAG: DUF4115 domain-containing protein [Nitrospiraceae bacterium]|nr:DUF4115 domain-containing protein [Nitrospiraceae bacterium]